MTASHIPVLLDEVIAALDPQPGDVVVDATFGAGDFFTVWIPDELYAMGPQLDLAKASCRRFQADAAKGRKK